MGHLAKVVQNRTESRWNDTAWPSGHLLVAETSVDDARRKKARRTLDLLGQRGSDAELLIDTFAVPLGIRDPAEAIFRQLHEGSDGQLLATDRAEREAIAWALAHAEDAIFVSLDKRAVLTALAELGRGRVAHSFDLWLHLEENGWLDLSEMQSLCELTKNHDQGLERVPGRVSSVLSGDG